MSRFYTRGRNTHWSDGRPAGFNMGPIGEQAATRATSRIGVAVAIFCALYFLAQFVRPLLRTQGWPV